MSKTRVTLYDTTLRDGQQTPGIDFSVADKIAIAQILDELGIDYIEGGYPGANPTDTRFFEQCPPLGAKLTAFGMTKRPGISSSNDPGLQALIGAAGDGVCFVAKAWDYHVHVALNCSLDENLQAIADSVDAARAANKQPIIDCEHFFDGYKANPSYALECAKTAHDGGADWVVLCDTNGGTQPHEVETIVRAVTDHIPDANLGIHAHDDTGQAVANSLAAISAGARQIQGTLNGIGERCGNANLTTLIATLALKPIFSERFEIATTGEALRNLRRISLQVDEIINRAPNPQAPYVGNSAFATKAGIHASAILKEPQTYEHVNPESVGNLRQVMVSDQGGKSNFIAELERIGLSVNKHDPRLEGLIQTVKDRESRGYAYEAAQASFEILARRRLGEVPKFFHVESYRTQVERRYNSKGEIRTISEAVVKVIIDERQILSVAEGDGPVNALDRALRKDLGKFRVDIADLELIDYKVRILDGGTEAVTRVLIDSADAQGERWTTIGVSNNIIDASFQALVDSINFKLMKSSCSNEG